MNAVQKTLVISVMSMGITWPLYGGAQAAGTASPHPAGAVPAMTDGEVRRVDAAAGKVTIRHGDIRHLDMPGMTMVFTVKYKRVLNGIKPGDRIRFMVVQEGGIFFVTDVQPEK